jgi:hypothetical protein
MPLPGSRMRLRHSQITQPRCASITYQGTGQKAIWLLGKLAKCPLIQARIASRPRISLSQPPLKP